MRPGGGKAKGANFEREVCRRLSEWVSQGKHADLFWRSAMSGGRATVAHKKGKEVRQAGDICSVNAEGHALTDQYYIECKNVKDCRFMAWVLSGKGPIAFWMKEANAQSRRYARQPMLIIKQNLWPTLVICHQGNSPHDLPALMSIRNKYEVFLFDDMTKGVFYG